MTGEATLTPEARLKLGALRYAVNEEASSYLAIMRLFTSGISGFLSDLSAAEVAGQLVEQGFELDVDTVDSRLSYLVEHGNLARSPRETEARSVKEYLTNRARYQLTQRGELVHRQVEELLGHAESASEVSSEMLGGILAGLVELDDLARGGLDDVEADDLARRIGTLFAQFERLVDSTRQFYTYLSQVLTRFDLGRDEFQAFKVALLDYLQRFVDEISRHMPQIADRLRSVEPRVPRLCERANVGQRLVGVDGKQARRAAGLSPEDWHSLHAWFVGADGRGSDADNVRGLATEAMRALLVNLRRIASSADREQSRYGDLVKLARWFDEADDDGAHELWVAAFGLYSARHLSFAADDDADPVPATASWWETSVAEVPLTLRKYGERRAAGRTGAREDFAAAKRARLAERARAQTRRNVALREIAGLEGRLHQVRLSEEARSTLMDLYARAISNHGRPLAQHESAVTEAALPDEDAHLRLVVRRTTDGSGTTVVGPQGRLQMVDMALDVEVLDPTESARTQEAGA
ncbi:MAG: TIGR02677 family protein [Nocardioidaceae bacterium]